jgi:hypothetical protein
MHGSPSSPLSPQVVLSRQLQIQRVGLFVADIPHQEGRPVRRHTRPPPKRPAITPHFRRACHGLQLQIRHASPAKRRLRPGAAPSASVCLKDHVVFAGGQIFRGELSGLIRL